MSRVLGRLSVTTALATLAVAAPALAHVELERTSPSTTKAAKTSVGSVSATFSGPIQRGTLTVKSVAGKMVSVDRGGRDPRNIARLLVELKPKQKAGRYTARWSIVAADGHEEAGTFRFRLTR